MIRDSLPVYIGDNALDHLVEYCHSSNLGRLTLVADNNTYPALGAAAEKALQDGGFDVQTVVLTGEDIIANEHYLMQVFVRADAEERTYIAVGSGTITDITRFVSHRSRSTFISLPTAPSVDGFTSIVAPLVIGGLKITALAHPPRALFADLPTLCAAPRRMIAAGFGDMIGKYTSIADWKLGNLLWDGEYSEPIAERVQVALAHCVEHARAIGSGSPEGVQSIMEGLIESGFCMVDFGRSLPASGSEHHLSHYWEMRLLRDGRPAILHGAKVAIGTIFAASRYERFRELTREQVKQRLEVIPLPERAREIEHIRAGYGPLAGQVIAEQAPFLDLNEESFGALKQRIIDNWDAIRDIAATVPSAQQIAELIEQAGGIVDPAALGLDSEYVSMALRYSHYLRNNFTAMKLGWLLGI